MIGASVLGGGFGLLAMLFLVVLALLWFCLPFAVFGIKQKLDNIADLLRHQNDHIGSLRTDLARLEAERTSAVQLPPPPAG